jgi:outer membrane murein-binding lipoprotein Lpp
MGYVKCSTMVLSVLFIAGCTSPEPPPPPAKTVFDPLTRQVDQAREVQKTVDENAEKTRKEIENQERGDSRP